MNSFQSIFPEQKMCHLKQVPNVSTGLAGACPGFLKGGGPISLGSLKKRSSDFERGGSNGLKGGGSSTFVSLG